MRRLKKFTSLILSSLLLACFFPPQTPFVYSIEDFWVQASPRRVSTVASYQFNFSLKKKVLVGQWIAIEFPPGTTIYPPIPEKEPDRRERLDHLFSSISISLKGGKHTLTTTKDGFLRFTIFVSVSFDPSYQNIKLHLSKNTGIMNPSKEGIYIYRMATEAEPSLVFSEAFQIVESKISTPKVIVSPSLISTIAAYKVDFNLGNGGSLKKGYDYIQISFPSDTKFLTPISEIKKEFITINNIPILVPPEGGGRLLKIQTPIDLPDAIKVVVKIGIGSGIQNPSKEGEYRLLVCTTTDTTWEKSDPYTMWTKEPVEKKKLSIESITIQPNLALEVAVYSIKIEFGEGKNLTTGDFIKVMFSFQEEPFLLPVSATLMNPHTVTIPDVKNPSAGSYHCQVSTNKEQEGVISDKFAILPPPIKTNLTLEGGTLGLDQWFVVPPKIILTNQDPLATIEYWFDDQTEPKKYQQQIPLKPGQYETTIYFFSSLGENREATQSLLLKVDTLPPALTMSTEKNPLKSPIIFGGTTEKNARIFLDQTEVLVDSEGHFRVMITPPAIGYYSHIFLVTDPAGNETKLSRSYWFGCRLIFQIGCKEVTANDVVENLVLPPFIKEGVTLLPFRYLGEKLQANIEFSLDPKTKQVKNIYYQTDTKKIILTINSPYAYVNQKKIVLSVPPAIVQGITVVPLRFVSEALDCKIEWDAAVQKIKLEYPVL